MKHSITILILIVLMIGPWRHESHAQYQNVRVSGTPSGFQPEEVCMAINPLNPQNLAAGANINYYYYSTNGGLTWTQGTLSSTYGVWGDPCLIFDGLGNLYFGHLSNPSSPGYWIDRIVVQRSTNGGAAWNSGTGIGFRPPDAQQDKEWLAADMTNSVYQNRLYVSWTEFDSYGSSNPSDSSRILCSYSTDQGITWTAPVRVSDQAGNCIDSDNTDEGAVPAIGPNGEVYIAWSGPLGLVFDKSTDGGVTFGQDVFIGGHPGGWDFDVPGISRCNGLPITACDVGASPFHGTIYVCWGDQRSGMTDTDVFMSKSTNGGATWSNARRVNQDLTTTHQFFPWMTIDQTTGYLYFVYYDRRNQSGNATDVYVARSTDGGETFTDFKVSESAFTPQASVFFGDYTGIAASDRKIYPIWMRMDGSNLSVWTALVTDSTGMVNVAEQRFQPEDFQLLQNYPNPFNPATTIEFSIPAAGNVALEVYNSIGEKVATVVNDQMSAGWHTVRWNAAQFATGVYFYQLQSGSFTDRRKLVLLK